MQLNKCRHEKLEEAYDGLLEAGYQMSLGSTESAAYDRRQRFIYWRSECADIAPKKVLIAIDKLEAADFKDQPSALKQLRDLIRNDRGIDKGLQNLLRNYFL